MRGIGVPPYRHSVPHVPMAGPRQRPKAAATLPHISTCFFIISNFYKQRQPPGNGSCLIVLLFWPFPVVLRCCRRALQETATTALCVQHTRALRVAAGPDLGHSIVDVQ